MLNQNNANLLHILFGCFEQAADYSQVLANTLLTHGVDPNHVDDEGKTPLHVAIKKQQIGAVRFAVDHAADKFDF